VGKGLGMKERTAIDRTCIQISRGCARDPETRQRHSYCLERTGGGYVCSWVVSKLYVEMALFEGSQ
jgi:hypothetical protein